MTTFLSIIISLFVAIAGGLILWKWKTKYPSFYSFSLAQKRNLKKILKTIKERNKKEEIEHKQPLKSDEELLFERSQKMIKGANQKDPYYF